MKRIVWPLLIAACLWFFMFSPWTAGMINFWTSMSFSAVVLMNLTFRLRPTWWAEDVTFNGRNLLLGVALAAALWGIFWTGNLISSWLFEFARPQVADIYGIKGGASGWLLSLLLILLIGPAEEIFWRGYVQHTFSRRWNPNVGLVVTTLIYALIHLWSFNFMLVMAALVAGAVWGLAYRFFPKYLGAIIVSHALWDAAVFVLFPI
ncbi:MAG: CPBP family intramembrane metalloprotease [Prevotellaceae bacterium]|jgi:membrane protease YdiL (CAAX protease family)|nr:CPBP family intramembrane metalloprotease [Prevotellaceae bacterium]